MNPKDCAAHPAFRHPDCAELETGGADITSKQYFSDPDNEAGLPQTRRNYPTYREVPRVAPLRRSAGHTITGSINEGDFEERFLRSMVAQLLLMTFEGQSPPDARLTGVLNRLKSGEAAGVIIRAENVVDANQLKTLSNLFSAGNRWPPLILIERPGASSRQSWPKPGFSLFPSPRELGDKGDALEAFNTYQRMAKELASSGISLNVGPVADICRDNALEADMLCYGSEIDHAAAFSSAFVFAHHNERVLSALRFDAAHSTPSSMNILKQLIDRRAPDALFVDLDLSGGMVTEKMADAQNELRRDGFGGVIIHTRSDVLSSGETAKALIESLNSGADMLLFMPSSDWSISEVAQIISVASDTGQLRPARVRDAFETVHRMNLERKQWRDGAANTASDASSSTYRRPVR